MIKKAAIITRDSPPRTCQVPVETRGQPEYPVDGWDLIEFGASPLRWVKTPRPEDDQKVSFTEALRLVHLTPQHTHSLYAIRPETYQAMVLCCPKCGSAGPAKHCRACNLARRNVVKDRPWSAQAKYCQEWTEDKIKHMRRIIPHDLHHRAAQAAKTLQADAEATALAQDSQVQVALRGLWHDEETGLDIPLRSVVNYAPAEGATRDDCYGSLYVTRDIAPNQWSGYAYTRGYHIVAALKQDLCGEALKHRRPHHVWVLVEPTEPHLVGRRRTSPEMLQAGRSAYENLLRVYARCLATGIWPGFDPAVPGSLDAWPEFFLEPWMTQGDGKNDRFFAVGAANALPLAA